MKSIHKIVQSHTNAQKVKTAASFTGNGYATKSFFIHIYKGHWYLEIGGTNVSSNSM